MPKEDLIIRTTDLIAGGAALGRLPDGRAVFVEGGAPDELVSIELTHEDKRWAKGRILEILEPSSDRVESPFPASVLGGAQWAHIAYAAQLQAKQQIVRTALERIGKLVNPQVEPIVASPEQWRYRNRIELSFGTSGGKPTLGMLAPGSNTQVVPVTDVALFPDIIQDIITRVNRWAQDSGLTAWQSGGELRMLTVRRSLATKELVVELATTSKVQPTESFVTALSGVPTTGILWSRSDSPRTLHHSASTTVLAGSATLTEVIADTHLTYHATSFFQVNVESAALLVDQLQVCLQTPRHSELVSESGGSNGQIPNQVRDDVHLTGEVIDLYAGVGLLGLTTTSIQTSLTLVEADAEASRGTLTNAQSLERLDTTTIVAASAEDYVAQYRLPSGAMVIVDPPRVGLDRSVVDALNTAKLGKLIYVSCDPATLARDLHLLSDKYQPVFIQPFDFFPQTPHVETLVDLLPRT